MDKVETAKLIDKMLDLYPNMLGKRTAEQILDVWAEAFAETKFEYASKSLIDHAREMERPPTIADICKRAERYYLDELQAKGVIYY